MDDSDQNPPYRPRSPLLLNADDSALLVIDMQERLLPSISDHERICWNVRRLLDGAGILDVHIEGSEQYPRGLGPTVPNLGVKIPRVAEKLMFSCRECQDTIQRMRERNCHKIVAVGIETHVCLSQTVLDLIAEGFELYVPVDAVGSRHSIDHDTALRRLELAGATLTTTEAVLFEWCEVAGTAKFKQISALVQEDPSTSNPNSASE